ncbi:MAG TPA: SH3 domain-containing protein [Bacillota bacterium]
MIHFEKNRKYIVIQDRESDYPDPISLKPNDRVEVVGEYSGKEAWPDWIRCRNQGNEGWVPRQIIQIQGNAGIILEEYSASEMRIGKNDIINGEKEVNGWIWGTNQTNGEVGWVPLEYISETDD